MRKRTETGAMMGMPATPATIEQCDLQRTIKLNDKKKLYFIVPINKEQPEIDEGEKPTTTKDKRLSKPVKTKEPENIKATKMGGTITTSYAIIDTGERKTMYGFNARHVWTVQKVEPSKDACTMKDSMLIKTDGWYIDLPKFNCPVNYKPDRKMLRQMQQKEAEPAEYTKPDCVDKFVSRSSGKGKLGFALSETRTMKMGSSGPMSEFKTTVETLEFSAAKIDSMLFEIPPGYTETKNEEDLNEKINMAEMMKEAFSKARSDAKMGRENNPGKTGMGTKQQDGIRIGVYIPTGEEQVNAADLQTYLADILTSGKIDAIPVASDEEAKTKNCDYTITTDFTKMKAGSKLGGLLKAIKNVDPGAAASFNVAVSLVLKKLADGSKAQDQKVDGKYDGQPNDAAKKALEECSRKILKGLR